MTVHLLSELQVSCVKLFFLLALKFKTKPRDSLGSYDHLPLEKLPYIIVLDLVTQIRDVVFVNVYLDLGNPMGSGFWNEGYMGEGRETGRSV